MGASRCGAATRSGPRWDGGEPALTPQPAASKLAAATTIVTFGQEEHSTRRQYAAVLRLPMRAGNGGLIWLCICAVAALEINEELQALALAQQERGDGRAGQALYPEIVLRCHPLRHEAPSELLAVPHSR